MNEINVVLGSSESDRLRKFIYGITVDEIKAAREDAGLDRMLNQTEIAEFIGCSPTTVREYERLGLPFGQIGSRKYYDKTAVRKWLLSAQFD